jgi:hypothetical protein
MKLDINKLELKSINENIYQIFHEGIMLKFWTPKILVPFGLENEYNKYVIKLEIDNNNQEHIHFIKIMEHIENLIKKKLNIEDNSEFKSIIQTRKNNKQFIECKIKSIKNNLITKIEYEDKDNNYLNTLYDLEKQSYIKTQIEVNGLWDYRTDKKDKNKIGLTVYATKLYVYKN